MSGEGDRTSTPPIPIANTAMSTSSASLEALIASLGGTAKEATFPMVTKLLIAVGSFFACTDDEWATAPSFASIGAYNALL